MPVIDLHSHSDQSDGTCSPEELVHNALKSGVQLFALTDHDTTEGVLRAQQMCRAHNLRCVSGVEISTRDHNHLHFLGYNVNLQDETFQAFLAQNRQHRVERIKKIIFQLRADNVDITEEEVFARAGNTISRAHVADALKAKKLASSRQDAFRKYLVEGKAGYVPSVGVSAIEAIKHIKRAGGVAVIAHPGIVTECWDFPAWTEAGLEGIEVFYPAHTFTLRQELLAIADKYGLFATGGSDYHGPKSGRVTHAGVQVPQNHFNKILHKLFNI
jgi:hypothetical protein